MTASGDQHDDDVGQSHAGQLGPEFLADLLEQARTLQRRSDVVYLTAWSEDS